MNVSERSYQKALNMLEFIKDNPECHITDIAAAVDMIKETTQTVVHKMVKAGTLTFKTKKYRGGKRHYYCVTGITLPPRCKVSSTEDYYQNTIMIDPINTDQYRKLPSFLQAITPVIQPETCRSVVIQGPTPEQHKLQSARIREERSKAQRGVKYTGEARI